MLGKIEKDCMESMVGNCGSARFVIWSKSSEKLTEGDWTARVALRSKGLFISSVRTYFMTDTMNWLIMNHLVFSFLPVVPVISCQWRRKTDYYRKPTQLPKKSPQYSAKQRWASTTRRITPLPQDKSPSRPRLLDSRQKTSYRSFSSCVSSLELWSATLWWCAPSKLTGGCEPRLITSSCLWRWLICW